MSTKASKDDDDSPSTPPSKPLKKRYVYRDFSGIPPDDGESVLEAISNMTPSNIKQPKLPVKLNAMLSDPDFSHIVSWMPHGRSWRILKPKPFVKEVLPRYFDYCNYNSFIRLVNAWGFHRFTSGPDRHSYYHELFLRGLPHLHGKMRRVAGKEKKPHIDQEDEPDLYSISRAHPLPLVAQRPLSLGSHGSQAASTGEVRYISTQGGGSPPSPPNLSQEEKNQGSTLSQSIAQALDSNTLVAKAQAQRSLGPLPSGNGSSIPSPQKLQWTSANGGSVALIPQVAIGAQAQQQQPVLVQPFTPATQQQVVQCVSTATNTPPIVPSAQTIPTSQVPVCSGQPQLAFIYVPVYTTITAEQGVVSAQPAPCVQQSQLMISSQSGNVSMVVPVGSAQEDVGTKSLK